MLRVQITLHTFLDLCNEYNDDPIGNNEAALGFPAVRQIDKYKYMSSKYEKCFNRGLMWAELVQTVVTVISRQICQRVDAHADCVFNSEA